MNDICIYHYSRYFYDTLKSNNKQGKKLQGNKEDNDEAIFFFIDPLNISKMPLYYKNKHWFYKQDTIVYEYMVDINIFSKIHGFEYELLEPPEKFDLFRDESLSDEEYDREIKNIVEKNNYQGSNFNNFKNIVLNNKGKTDYYFRRYTNSSLLDKYINLYAPFVPHLKIKIPEQEIFYTKCTEKKFGNGNYVKVIKNTTVKNKTRNWHHG